MKPIEVRQRIEAMLRASSSPESAAILSRMPRPKCACGGRLSRAGRCARCGATTAAPRDAYRRPELADQGPFEAAIPSGSSIFAK